MFDDAGDVKWIHQHQIVTNYVTIVTLRLMPEYTAIEHKIASWR